jgi:hypothetical protein
MAETQATPRGLGADEPGSGLFSRSLEWCLPFHNAVRAFFRTIPLIGEAQTPFKSNPRLFGTRGALPAWLMQLEIPRLAHARLEPSRLEDWKNGSAI